MQKCSEAAGQFLRTSNPEDEFFLIEFNERSRLSFRFTKDSAGTEANPSHQGPGTHVAARRGPSRVVAMKVQNSRKALVSLPDGGDNHSRCSEGEIKETVRESDVQVYAMGILDPNDSPIRAAEERNGPPCRVNWHRRADADFSRGQPG